MRLKHYIKAADFSSNGAVLDLQAVNVYIYAKVRIHKTAPSMEMQVKGRTDRLKTVRKLIKNNRIESQEALLGYLQKEGFDVTQATLSRDLKLLKVGKVSDGTTGYVYTLTDESERHESEQIYVQDFLRGYVSVDYSGNTVVIKTIGGHADSVSNAIDSLNMEEVLGTVAGENCIFACLREGVTGPMFLAALKRRIPDIEF